MRVTSHSDLRRNLSAAVDRVAENREPLVITRDRGKPTAVLMSLEDYASHEETRYLLASPANSKRLFESIAELDGGGGVEKTLPE